MTREELELEARRQCAGFDVHHRSTWLKAARWMREEAAKVRVEPPVEVSDSYKDGWWAGQIQKEKAIRAIGQTDPECRYCGAEVCRHRHHIPTDAELTALLTNPTVSFSEKARIRRVLRFRRNNPGQDSPQDA